MRPRGNFLESFFQFLILEATLIPQKCVKWYFYNIYNIPHHFKAEKVQSDKFAWQIFQLEKYNFWHILPFCTKTVTPALYANFIAMNPIIWKLFNISSWFGLIGG